MSDYIIRGTAADGQIRFFAANSRDLVEEGRRIHNTSPVATAALGRLLTAGAMIGSMCKNDSDLITLQIQCSGPIGGLTVTADTKANVKGTLNNSNVIIPANSKGKLDVAGALGLGVLTVIKDIGMKEPYSGQTQLVSGEIAEDLTYYYANSEQIPTSIALGVLMSKDNTVRQAGGFIIQLMPFATDEVISLLEEKIKNISSITSLLDSGKSIEAIIGDIFEKLGYVIHDKIPANYYCNCSRERVYKAVMSVGKSSINEMIADDEPIEVKCHFCNRSYTYDIEDLKSMLNN